jgi:deazaflavin-dependent oxidoreductase (nitroreductase family)
VANSDLARRLAPLASKSTLLLTHRGRKSGKSYDVVIWFMVEGDTIYLETLNDRRQWVRNVKATPEVTLTIDGNKFTGRVQPITDSAERARVDNLTTRKYLAARILYFVTRPLVNFLPDRRAAFRVLLDSPAD